MSTLWAIEVTPLYGRRPKPWLDYETVSRTRREAWKKFRADATPDWLEIIKSRQRRGFYRAVKVTIQIAKEKP